MNECLMVDLSPQISVMFQDNKAVRAFIDINAVAEQVNELIEKAKETAELAVKEQKSKGFIKFTNRELRRMAEPFRSEFKAKGGTVCVEKTIVNDEPLYKIYYHRNGNDITVSDKDLKTAKKLFIKAV